MLNDSMLAKYCEKIVNGQTPEFIKETGIHLMEKHYNESDSYYQYGIIVWTAGDRDTEFELMKCSAIPYDMDDEYEFNFIQFDPKTKVAAYTQHKNELRGIRSKQFTYPDAKRWIDESMDMLLKDTRYKYVNGVLTKKVS